MPRPRLIVITDTTVAAPPLLYRRIETVLAKARAGSVLVQLRDKDLSARARLSLGGTLVELCQRFGQSFVVNERCDIAVLLDADGVHLGEASVPSEEARAVLPEGAWISRAAHDLQGLPDVDADAVLLSPIISRRKGRAPLLLAGLRQASGILAARGARRPLLFGLGGVTAATAAPCLSSGADGVAVVGAALRDEDPEPLLAALRILR